MDMVVSALSFTQILSWYHQHSSDMLNLFDRYLLSYVMTLTPKKRVVGTINSSLLISIATLKPSMQLQLISHRTQLNFWPSSWSMTVT